MNAWGEDVGATVILSIGIMGAGLFCILGTMAVGALLKKVTGRENAITRWMAR
jgi:hypothetical protein